MDTKLNKRLFKEFRLKYSNKYQFENDIPIGEGAYGTVYKASDINREIDVAIKIFHEGKTPDGASRAWNVTSKLINSQVAPTSTIEDFALDETEYVAVVSRFIPGKTLKQVFAWWDGQAEKDKQGIAEDFSKTFIPSLLDVLVTCHSHGVGHGYLHEGNIMTFLTDLGMVFKFAAVLIDFDNASIKTEYRNGTEKEKIDKDVRLFNTRIGPYITTEWEWGKYIAPMYSTYKTSADIQYVYSAMLEYIEKIEQNATSKEQFIEQISGLLPRMLGGFSVKPIVDMMREIANDRGYIINFEEAHKTVMETIRNQHVHMEVSITMVDGRKNQLYRGLFD